MEKNILALVYEAIDEVNAESPDGVVLQKGPDVRLLDGQGSIDSLTFVNLIIAVEEQIQRTFQTSIVLVNESSMTLQERPFRTVGTLAAYAESLLASEVRLGQN